MSLTIGIYHACLHRYFPCRAEWYMRRCELRYGGNGLGGQNADPAQDPVVLKRASPAKIAHVFRIVVAAELSFAWLSAQLFDFLSSNS